MIRPVKGGYGVFSHTGRRMSKQPMSKAGAEHRLKQVEFFKNLRKSKGGPGSLAAKVKNKGLLKKMRGM